MACAGQNAVERSAIPLRNRICDEYFEQSHKRSLRADFREAGTKRGENAACMVGAYEVAIGPGAKASAEAASAITTAAERSMVSCLDLVD